MMSNTLKRTIAGVAVAAALAAPLGLRGAAAHCDTLDGPVVTDAREALKAGDAKVVLKWVTPEHENEVREAFEQALAVRKLGDEARELADRYFFETLVRVHREGEGAPYTGLKPGGSVEPAIAEADQALVEGKVDDLAERIARVVADGIRSRFRHALETQRHAGDSVEAGREFVKAYVEYVHYVEGLHEAATGAAHAHGPAEGSHGAAAGRSEADAAGEGHESHR
jgi:hypothetical protein